MCEDERSRSLPQRRRAADGGALWSGGPGGVLADAARALQGQLRLLSVLRRGSIEGWGDAGDGCGEPERHQRGDGAGVSEFEPRPHIDGAAADAGDSRGHAADADRTAERSGAAVPDRVCECLEPAAGENREPQERDCGERGAGRIAVAADAEVYR